MNAQRIGKIARKRLTTLALDFEKLTGHECAAVLRCEAEALESVIVDLSDPEDPTRKETKS